MWLSVSALEFPHEVTCSRSCDRGAADGKRRSGARTRQHAVAESPTSTQASANSSTTAQPAATDNTPPSPADDPANAASTANAPKETHNKNINDIDNIGNRNVGSTGKSMGNWYGIDTDVKLGKQYAMMVEANARMIQDPVIVEYVNRVGQNLVRNSDAKVPFTIKVVDSDEINAFALPGGFFYVNSGLILAADNEAELAGVMAHEIAHVAARHQTREHDAWQLSSNGDHSADFSAAAGLFTKPPG